MLDELVGKEFGKGFLSLVKTEKKSRRLRKKEEVIKQESHPDSKGEDEVADLEEIRRLHLVQDPSYEQGNFKSTARFFSYATKPTKENKLKDT